MAKIEEGGQITKLTDKTVKSISFNMSDKGIRLAEMWINGESVSYLSLTELLDIREEINATLKEMIF